MNKNILVIIACAGTSLSAMDMRSIQAAMATEHEDTVLDGIMHGELCLRCVVALNSAQAACATAAAPYLGALDFNGGPREVVGITYPDMTLIKAGEAWSAVPGTRIVLYGAAWQNPFHKSGAAVTVHALDVDDFVRKYYNRDKLEKAAHIKVVSAYVTRLQMQRDEIKRLHIHRATRGPQGISCTCTLGGATRTVGDVNALLPISLGVCNLSTSLSVGVASKFFGAVKQINDRQSLAERAAINYINSNLAAIQAGSKQEVTKAQTMLADVPPAHRCAIGAYFGLESNIIQ